jgi:protein TIF31
VESPVTASPQVSECSQTSPEGNDASSGVNVEDGDEKQNTDDTNHTESKDGKVEPEQTSSPEVADEAVTAEDVTKELIATEPPKSWADYSDGEVEVEAVEVAS